MKKIFKLAPPIVWMGVIFYFSSIPNLKLTGELSAYDLVLRKLAHITEYAILAFLWWHAQDKNGTIKKRALITVLVSVLYAMSDELHQHYVYSRDGKILDVAIDTMGVLAGTYLAYRNDRHKRQKSDSYNEKP